jgi:hypothetical protein
MGTLFIAAAAFNIGIAFGSWGELTTSQARGAIFVTIGILAAALLSREGR